MFKTPSDLKVGDRIIEGKGRDRKVYKVVAIDPDPICKNGVHVTVSLNGDKLQQQFCYTAEVKVQ